MPEFRHNIAQESLSAVSIIAKLFAIQPILGAWLEVSSLRMARAIRLVSLIDQTTDILVMHCAVNYSSIRLKINLRTSALVKFSL